MRLTVLGCSGSMPGPDSPASGYLVRSRGEGGTALLLDLGSGSFGPLLRTLDPGTLDALVLSHLHPDHYADIAALAVWLRYGPGASRGRPLPVHGPAGTREHVLALTEMDDVAFGQTFEVHELRRHEAFTVGELTVEPHEMRHPVPAFGFRVTGPSAAARNGDPAGTVTLGYTGDTDVCDGVAAVAAAADLLLAEAAFPEHETVRDVHLTGSRAGAVATAAGAKRLVLTHIQPWIDADAVVAAAHRHYAGPIDRAHSGAFYDL